MNSTTQPTKVIYTAKVHTTGGREGGTSLSSDGHLNIKHSLPGASGDGTNPEQLFAAGWSTCFESAIVIEARKRRITLPADLAIDAEVDLCQTDGGYTLEARFNINMPGIDRDVAKELFEAADQICPYSKVTRGNIKAEFTLV